MLLFGLLMLGLLSGCGEIPMKRDKQVVGNLTVFLEYPERLQINQEASMIITIIDQDERTISNAIVALDLEMPEMPMGQNQPLADALGGGRYRVRVTYTMLGEWHTRVRVQWNGREYLANFTHQVGD